MTERIFQKDDGHWYYRTRGNHAVGPFDNQSLAEVALTKQVRSWAGRTPARPPRSRTWHPSRIFRRSATRQP